jgi:hypothetical protein
LGEAIQCSSPWLNYLLETRWEDSNDLQKLTEEFVRFLQVGRGESSDEEITRGSVLWGRRLGELQHIISVQDPERLRMIVAIKPPERSQLAAVHTNSGALLD